MTTPEKLKQLVNNALARILNCVLPEGVLDWRSIGETDANGFDICKPNFHTWLRVVECRPDCFLRWRQPLARARRRATWRATLNGHQRKQEVSPAGAAVDSPPVEREVNDLAALLSPPPPQCRSAAARGGLRQDIGSFAKRSGGGKRIEVAAGVAPPARARHQGHAAPPREHPRSLPSTLRGSANGRLPPVNARINARREKDGVDATSSTAAAMLPPPPSVTSSASASRLPLRRPRNARRQRSPAPRIAVPTCGGATAAAAEASGHGRRGKPAIPTTHATAHQAISGCCTYKPILGDIVRMLPCAARRTASVRFVGPGASDWEEV